MYLIYYIHSSPKFLIQTNKNYQILLIFVITLAPSNNENHCHRRGFTYFALILKANANFMQTAFVNFSISFRRLYSLFDRLISLCPSLHFCVANDVLVLWPYEMFEVYFEKLIVNYLIFLFINEYDLHVCFSLCMRHWFSNDVSNQVWWGRCSTVHEKKTTNNDWLLICLCIECTANLPNWHIFSC